MSVHHNRRWDVDFLNARDALLQGVLGELKLLRNDYSAGYEGSVYDWGIHIIDQTMMLSEGMAFVGISATMAKPNRDNPTEGEGFFSANLVREDGALYQMGMLPVIQGNAFRPGRMTPRFMLAGTKGVMIQDWCQTPMDGFGAGGELDFGHGVEGFADALPEVVADGVVQYRTAVVAEGDCAAGAFGVEAVPEQGDDGLHVGQAGHVVDLGFAVAGYDAAGHARVQRWHLEFVTNRAVDAVSEVEFVRVDGLGRAIERIDALRHLGDGGVDRVDEGAFAHALVRVGKLRAQ